MFKHGNKLKKIQYQFGYSRNTFKLISMRSTFLNQLILALFIDNDFSENDLVSENSETENEIKYTKNIVYCWIF